MTVPTECAWSIKQGALVLLFQFISIQDPHPPTPPSSPAPKQNHRWHGQGCHDLCLLLCEWVASRKEKLHGTGMSSPYYTPQDDIEQKTASQLDLKIVKLSILVGRSHRIFGVVPMDGSKRAAWRTCKDDQDPWCTKRCKLHPVPIGWQ